jgi:hypothetical protein
MPWARVWNQAVYSILGYFKITLRAKKESGNEFSGCKHTKNSEFSFKTILNRNAEQGSKQQLRSLKFSLFYRIFTLKQIEHVVLPLPMRKLPGAAMDIQYNIYQRVRNNTRDPRCSPHLFA